jgi:hypothetical protein
LFHQEAVHGFAVAEDNDGRGSHFQTED